jgi:hypothetical protein
MKTCRRCGHEKPLDEFSKHVHTRDRRQSYCKPCAREYRRNWRVEQLARDRGQDPDTAAL